jgi:GT2 family glycosyltransferase
MQPKVTILTLSWNRKVHTLEWLESVSRLDYPNFDILVVDNGSSDGSNEAISKRFPHVSIIENGKNLGYAGGFNVGLEHAFRDGADYVLIMNNDAVIDTDALTGLVDVAQSDQTIGFTSGKVFHYFRPDEIQTLGMTTHPLLITGGQIGSGEIDHGQHDEPAERELSDDVFLLVRRDVFERIGGYDEDFAFYGHENVDWCLRARKAGFKIMYAPKAKLWHKGRTGGGWTAFYVYYQTRNDFVLIAKHASPLKSVLAALMLVLYHQPKWFTLRVRPTRLSQVTAYLRGQASGIAWLLRRNKPARPIKQTQPVREVAER